MGWLGIITLVALLALLAILAIVAWDEYRGSARPRPSDTEPPAEERSPATSSGVPAPVEPGGLLPLLWQLVNQLSARITALETKLERRMTVLILLVFLLVLLVLGVIDVDQIARILPLLI